jgi:hypothetical protein
MRLASYLALATCVGVGGYWLSADGKPAAPAPTLTAVRTAKLPVIVVPPASLDTDEEPILDDEPAEEVADEVLRGHGGISDPAEFAMVFSVGADTYVRLSNEARATSHGTPRLILADRDSEITSVVAPVTVGALPPAYRAWANRDVLVNGDCKARVIGFAEVSRVAGEASDPYSNFDDEGNRLPVEDWTVESVMAENVTLAAKLDGDCDGTWARAADWSPAVIVAHVEAPALEQAALDDLIAMKGEEIAASWKAQGGEGTWREHAEITTSTWLHPDTNERWIFVQASHPGYCGDPGIAAMAVYRAGPDGKPRFATELNDAGVNIDELVDLDGDGQPEFLGSRGDSTELYDLADTSHDSIYVQRHHYGCGC